MRSTIERVKMLHNLKFSIFDFIKWRNKKEPAEKK